MAQTYTINGTDYTFPDVDDSDWGQNVTDWAGAVSSFLLQRSGGTFTLGAAVDFGTSFGLKLKDLESKTTGASTDASAFLRLAKTDYISWRNNAGGANLTLEKNTSDLLEFATKELINEDATQTLTNKTLTAPVISTISNSGTLTLPTGAETLVGRNTTDTLTNKTIDVDSNTVSNIEVDNLKSGVLDTNLTSVSGSDDTLASAKAIKTYVDTQVGGSSLEFTGDTTTGTPTVDLDAQALVISGGTGLASTASGLTLTMSIDSSVATLTGSQALTNKTIDVDSNTVSNIELDNLKSGVLDTDLSDGTSASDDTIASAKAIKTYVDAQVTAQDLDFSGDSGGAQNVDLDSQSLTIAGGTGIDTAGTAQTLTVNIDSTVATLTGAQTLSSKTLTTPVIASLQQASGTNTLTMPAATDTLVARATTDTLTNKTLTGANIGTGKVTDYLAFDSVSDPGATPDSNDVFLYAKENKLYYKDSNDVVAEVGSGGGAGDADTIQLKAANDFSAVNSAPWYTGNNPVPGGGGSIGGTWELSTSNPLINTNDATKVFHYSNGTSNRKNDYFEIELDVPNYAKGHNLVVQLFYRTVGAEDTDFLFFARDRTADYETTTSSSGALNTITLASATGFAVGDRICIQDSSDARHFRYVTAVSGSDITFNGSAITVGSGDVVVSKYFTDELNFITAENNTTNYEGKIRKWAFQINDTTTKIRVGFLYDNTATSTNELFFDQILLSSNQFLQTSSQGLAESYTAKSQADFFDNTGNAVLWDTSLLIPRGSSPALADSRLITIEDMASVNHGTVTGIKAKVPIVLDIQMTNSPNDSGFSAWYFNGDGSNADDNPFIAHHNETSAGGDGIWVSVAGSIKLNKNEMVYYRCNSADSRTGGCSITATPQVNDVVLLNSQDEIFTDWVSYTPTFEGLGADVSNVKASWRRVGSNMEVVGSLTSGTVTSDLCTVGLPSGYSISLGVEAIQYGPQLGTWQTNTNQLNPRWIYFQATETGKVYVTEQSSARAPTTRLAGNIVTSSSTINDFQFTVPIAGWTSTFNPVLSMPLIDFDTYENVYSARCTISGSTVTVVSQSPSNWLDASASAGAATSTLKTQAGIFSVVPTAVVTPTQMGPGGDEIALVMSDIAIDGSGVVTFSMAGGDIEGNIDVSSVNFNIVAMRQGADYRQPPQATAAVIKPSVCILRDIKSVGAVGGEVTDSMDDSVQKRDLNTMYGETWFCTLSASVFTLEPGMYKFTCRAPWYQTTYTSMGLYDVTNSQWVPGARNAGWFSGSSNQSNALAFDAVTTITSSTQFQLGYTVNSGHGHSTWNMGVGQTYTAAEAVSVFAEVVIEKLK